MIALDGNSLTLEDFHAIVTDQAMVALSPGAREKIEKSRRHVDKACEGKERIYSINTGFGILSKVTIDKSQLAELQVNLIRSHCAGVGEPHSEEESRAILLLRTNVLAKGFSGVRLELVDRLVEMLNKRVHPVIPCKGSVGASGDLAPLAHLAAVLIGEGEAFQGGTRKPGAQAMKAAGITPLVLAAKEGLSLINGTQQMTGLGALILGRAERLADLADLVCTTSLEGVLGTAQAFVEWVQETRPYEGQIRSAQLLRSFMADSEISKSHANCDRVQDPYSFRCVPQVHGACRDLVSHVRRVLTIELNAATDNPLVHPETGNLVSNGNFHGQPVAFALDILGMGIAELGSIAERRIAKLIDPSFSELPTFLVKNAGLNSGLMMHHVTAAALVAESRLLTHPGSTDSIPTNVEKEDHVSMGPLCARKAKQILENTETILAIEALTACQALEFRKPLKPAIGPRFLYRTIREKVAPLENDRYLHLEIEWVRQLFVTGELHRRAKKEGLL